MNEFSVRQQYEMAYRAIRIAEHSSGLWVARHNSIFWNQTPEITREIKRKAYLSYILSFRQPRGLVRGIEAQSRRAYALLSYTRRSGKMGERLRRYGMLLPPSTGDQKSEQGASISAGWEL